MFSGSFKIDRLLLAIAEHEGWSIAKMGSTRGGSRSYRNHNPGNLRKSPFQSGIVDGFAVFSSDDMGFMALHWDLMQKARGKTVTGLSGTSTLHDLVKVYAPESDGNNVEAYISHIENKTGLSRDTKLRDVFSE